MEYGVIQLTLCWATLGDYKMEYKKIYDKIMNKEISRKNFLKLIGGSVLSVLLFSKTTLAEIWFRDTDGSMINLSDLAKVDNGTANGQILFWDTDKYNHTETSELVWNSTDKILTTTNTRTINDGSITRDVDGNITEIIMGNRTIIINRDVNNIITGWEDADYEWTLTRNVDGNIESWGATTK